MALRLKYAGFPPDLPVVGSADGGARAGAARRRRPAANLYVLPTYTAMLEVRGLLAKRGGVAPYWEEPR